jgi:hypothetical protein
VGLDALMHIVHEACKGGSEYLQRCVRSDEEDRT